MKIKCISIGIIACTIVLSACAWSKGITIQAESVQDIDMNEGEDVYGIGSTSKMFTTVAVMKLAEEGKIDLDKALVTYIPEFKMEDDRYVDITPRMLLDHSSGIMGTVMKDAFLYGESDKRYHDTFLEKLSNQRLKADPGEYSVYCNDGFTLAEILVERVSGMDFSEYVDNLITSPLGMSHTFTPTFNFDETYIKPLYYGDNVLPYEKTQPIGSGGIYSSVEDLCKFSQIFMRDNVGILSEKTLGEMEKPWYLSKKLCQEEGDSQFGFGLGWDAVNTYPYNQYGIQALSKGGATNGYYTNLTVLPEQNLSIAVSISGGNYKLPQLAAQEILLEVLQEEGIIDEILGRKETPEYTVAVIPEHMKAYEGYYMSMGMMKITFSDENTMKIEQIDGEKHLVQDFVYTDSGEFMSNNGGYIGASGLMEAESGNSGFCKLHFSEEPNGKTYLMGTVYETLYGLGESCVTAAFAEKADDVSLTDEVESAWAKRDNKRYYLVDEKYNSGSYLNESYTKVKRVEEQKGYTEVTSLATNCRIIDEDNAISKLQVPIMLGRDLVDYHFYSEDGVEFLKLGDRLYVSEDVMSSTKDMKAQIHIDSSLNSQWFYIENDDAGEELTIEVPKDGEYYVYNKNNVCVTSSLFTYGNNTIVLPKEGFLVFVGEQGATFTIK